MTDMTPTTFDFNTMTGQSKAAKPIPRPLSSLKGYFADAAAYEAALAGGDPMVYEYFDMGVPETSGNFRKRYSVGHGDCRRYRLIGHGAVTVT